MSIEIATSVVPPEALPPREDLVRGSTIAVIGNTGVNETVKVFETTDFGRKDPWSELTRGVVATKAADGKFRGKKVTEFGVGDGRNLMQAVGVGDDGGQIDPTVGRLAGVDIEDWRAGIAQRNLDTIGVTADTYGGDAIAFLQTFVSPDEPLSGWGIACLPQAPLDKGTSSSADGYGDLPSLEAAHGMEVNDKPVDAYGLTLNAAFLHELRGRIDPHDFKLLLTLSGRIPDAAARDMFAKTGWEIEEQHTTGEPVPQDPDTSVQYIIDDADAYEGHPSFYERDQYGNFAPLSAQEAENRRVAHQRQKAETGMSEPLNVSHHVSVFQLAPTAKSTKE